MRPLSRTTAPMRSPCATTMGLRAVGLLEKSTPIKGGQGAAGGGRGGVKAGAMRRGILPRVWPQSANKGQSRLAMHGCLPRCRPRTLVFFAHVFPHSCCGPSCCDPA